MEKNKLMITLLTFLKYINKNFVQFYIDMWINLIVWKAPLMRVEYIYLNFRIVRRRTSWWSWNNQLRCKLRNVSNCGIYFSARTITFNTNKAVYAYKTKLAYILVV